MRNSHKAVAGSVLFALNIFIIVLLLAGDALTVPRWLQPVGRLHPVILHFPIVILMLAMLLEYFRYSAAFAQEKFYQIFTDYLLVLGVLLSAITVISGLFLSREPGYEGGTVQWHKWFGVCVVFVGSAMYFWRNRLHGNVLMVKIMAVALVIGVAITGHLGGEITHGENFVLGPVMDNTKKQVPFEKAYVFNDVIEPIFQAKCISCHNPDKMKGGLMLSDSASVLKGGKHGKLFVAGKPEISLILQRIHLPETDKKHMAPTGKTQLTDVEVRLLYLWIKGKGKSDFNKKVAELPANDSLRMLAATLLKPTSAAEETYDFSAASDNDIKKLNNNYRVIYPLANGSPALGVNIYNKSTYNVKALDELSPISKQVVSLDLNKMPVKDVDLKAVAKLENLRYLNLNFTEITGAGLKELTSLKHLQSLSIAGTKVGPDAAKAIAAIKSLREFTVWNTGLGDPDLVSLQKINPSLNIIKGVKDDGKPVKLSAPQLKNTAFVISGATPLLLSHPINGVDIRYTTDGTVPDSSKSLLYKPGVMLAGNTTIRARAFKAGWLGSDTVQFVFYKNTFTPDSISYISPADDKYKGDGPKTLIDKELGGMGFGNGKWNASQKELSVLMFFNKPISAGNVSINTLRNTGSQIFLPASVEVWGGPDAKHLKLLSQVKPAAAKKDDPNITSLLDCKFKMQALSCIKIVAKPVIPVPAWHPAKGKPGWVFVDEIFIN